jgi:ubiquitin thioesterase OTU1
MMLVYELASVFASAFCSFNHQCRYNQRCYVVFDGLHYDPVEMILAGGDSSSSITTFSAYDAEPQQLAMAFIRHQQEKRQFTDTASFTLRCLNCQTPLTGTAHAQQHAQETGHTNFGEV